MFNREFIDGTRGAVIVIAGLALGVCYPCIGFALILAPEYLGHAIAGVLGFSWLVLAVVTEPKRGG